MKKLVKYIFLTLAYCSYVYAGPNEDLLDGIRTKNIEKVRKAIKQKADVNAVDSAGNSYLFVAVWESGQEEIVKLLIEAKANVNGKTKGGETPLMFVSNAKIAKILITAGADVNAVSSDGKSPIYNAVLTRDVELVKLLINSGANVNIKNQDGITPLMMACLAKPRSEKTQIVKLLLAANAKVNEKTKDKKPETALSIAKESGDNEVVELLIKAGAK